MTSYYRRPGLSHSYLFTNTHTPSVLHPSASKCISLIIFTWSSIQDLQNFYIMLLIIINVIWFTFFFHSHWMGKNGKVWYYQVMAGTCSEGDSQTPLQTFKSKVSACDIVNMHLWPQWPLLRLCPRETHMYLHRKIHPSIVYNSKKCEKNLNTKFRKMDKLTWSLNAIHS